MKTSRQIKHNLLVLLQQDDFEAALREISRFPARVAVNPLFSFLYNTHDRVRWRAVTAMGIVVANLAAQERESARVVMRRFLWNLNDESGGIGWGSPEAMGEIMARSGWLAEEYADLMVSYMMPEGNFLEHPLLQRGLLWGVGRLAHARPAVIAGAAAYLPPFLRSSDPVHRGLAAWGCGALGTGAEAGRLAQLQGDRSPLQLYEGLQLVDYTVGDLAALALARINALRGRSA